jgi:hypothetical protein
MARRNDDGSIIETRPPNTAREGNNRIFVNVIVIAHPSVAKR